MKRYLLFAYDQYYPSGGWNDFVDTFDTFEEAKAAQNRDWEFWAIIDTTTMKEALA